LKTPGQITANPAGVEWVYHCRRCVRSVMETVGEFEGERDQKRDDQEKKGQS
jgi:hypothetical protein